MNRRALVIAVCAATLLTAGWWRFAWQPQQASASSAAARQEAAEATQAKLLDAVRDRTRRRTAEPAVRAELESLQKAVPPTTDLAGLLQEIASVAAGAKVQLVSMAPSAAPAAKATTTTAAAPGKGSAKPAPIAPAGASTKVAIGIVGSFDQVVQFLDDLAHAPRLVRVDSLSIAADREGRLTAQLEAVAASYAGTASR